MIKILVEDLNLEIISGEFNTSDPLAIRLLRNIFLTSHTQEEKVGGIIIRIKSQELRNAIIGTWIVLELEGYYKGDMVGVCLDILCKYLHVTKEQIGLTAEEALAQLDRVKSSLNIFEGLGTEQS